MNERIQKLAEQATKYFPKTETSGEYWTFDKQKFAELIVADCVELCSKHFVGAVGTYPGAHNNAVKHCVDSIRSHFGVE